MRLTIRWSSLVILLVLSLASCVAINENQKRSSSDVTPHAKDGAPLGPPPSKFQHVKPVYEPFSRYGNPDKYAVNGRTYKVMKSASGYKARGLASWYGTRFHKQRTSSGENYDMYAMTAAHKTLPLPTYVKVKNISNGRETVVKVNDRGPFHADRVIDLSYAAATKLGLLPNGTALVEIEALTINDPRKNQEAHYYVQAGAFYHKELAKNLLQQIIKLTPSPAFIENYKQAYIVKVGPFADRKMTNTLREQLNKIGVLGAFIMMQ